MFSRKIPIYVPSKELPATGSQWIDHTPDVPGWYWYRPYGAHYIQGPVEIKLHPILGLVIYNARLEALLVEALPRDWAGPLPKPNA